jgi:alcohol dehydrogenase YqhD (iron-dependent ADH family)
MEFAFYNPTKIIFGKGKIAEIGTELAAYGAKKILLIAGNGSIRKNGVYEQVVSSLQSNNLQWSEVWGVQPNPTLTKVNEIISIAKKENTDSILAVGGGSVIDTAKAVAAGFYVANAWNLFEGKDSIRQTLPLFTVLTISATSTEMDPYAVITNEKEKKKWAITSDLLYPVVSIIDPSAQTSLPWNQTVNGAVDGISHIMEFYFLGKAQETTFAINDSLTTTIIKMTDELQKDHCNLTARSNLAWALTLALNGISGAGLLNGDWSVHTIEHAVSAIHPEVAHGAGLAVIFPAWILYMHHYNPETFKRWAKNIWHCNNVPDAVKKMREKYSLWGAPISLTALGIEKEEIPKIAENATQKGPIRSFRPLTKEDVEKILNLAL